MAKKKKVVKKTTKKKTTQKKNKKVAKKAAKKKVVKKTTKKPAKKAAKKTTKKTVAKKVAKKKAVAKAATVKKKTTAKAVAPTKKATSKKEVIPAAEKPVKKAKAAPVESPVEVIEELELSALENEEPQEPEEVILTDAEGRRLCRVSDCDQVATVDGYCRYHYLLFWKKIQNRKKILVGGKLERYIEELTARYTDKFIEILRKDLRSEKDFLSAVHELELDDSSSGNFEDEDKSYIEEIRGMASEGGSRNEEDY
ncbi:MAG: hypothetical protein H6626_03760 [Pseudobdellovibrionaceae bacterium]|nr:hypothetical protein [Bdellovibrionales bacterium]USN48214.1 MAG: hypothetical protein H6626_03760 [Pseudobdellovibrionaceae bacterium]